MLTGLIAFPPLLTVHPVMPRNDPFKRTSEQPDRYPATEAQSRLQQERGFAGHRLPERAEEPGKLVAEKATCLYQFDSLQCYVKVLTFESIG
jgi:hypothetical protein